MRGQLPGRSLIVDSLTVIYKPALKAVNSVSFEAQPGKLLTLLGPSGSGKTTILSAINGDLTSANVLVHGRVFLGGEDVSHLPLNKRGIGRVFQKYSLWNHMSVFDNIAFPLQVRGVSRQGIKRKVKSMLELVRLSDIEAIERRKPSQLSGGQQQRVALARALVFDPPLLLLDEPLAALDKNLREQLQTEISELQKKLGITLIYVTHDQSEALSISDTIAVVNSGRIVQIGTPLEIYTEPKHRFVADFLGDSNFIEGTVAEIEGNSCVVETRGGARVRSMCAPNVSMGSKVTLTIRPEKILLGVRHENCENSFIGRVSQVRFLGGILKYEVAIPPDLLITVACLNRNDVAARLMPSKEVRIAWHGADCKMVGSEI